jgi:hypothetical protein
MTLCRPSLNLARVAWARAGVERGIRVYPGAAVTGRSAWRVVEWVGLRGGGGGVVSSHSDFVGALQVVRSVRPTAIVWCGVVSR